MYKWQFLLTQRDLESPKRKACVGFFKFRLIKTGRPNETAGGLMPWPEILDCIKSWKWAPAGVALPPSLGHSVTCTLDCSAKTNPAINDLVNYLVTETRKAATIIHQVAQKSIQLKTDVFISVIFHLVFLGHNWFQVIEIVDKVGQLSKRPYVPFPNSKQLSSKFLFSFEVLVPKCYQCHFLFYTYRRLRCEGSWNLIQLVKILTFRMMSPTDPG